MARSRVRCVARPDRAAKRNMRPKSLDASPSIPADSERSADGRLIAIAARAKANAVLIFLVRQKTLNLTRCGHSACLGLQKSKQAVLRLSTPETWRHAHQEWGAQVAECRLNLK